MRVVAQIGFSSDEKADLTDEYHIYEHLAKKEVERVPKAFGLFVSGEPEGPLMLLITDEGKPIEYGITDEQKYV